MNTKQEKLQAQFDSLQLALEELDKIENSYIEEQISTAKLNLMKAVRLTLKEAAEFAENYNNLLQEQYHQEINKKFLKLVKEKCDATTINKVIDCLKEALL